MEVLAEDDCREPDAYKVWGPYQDGLRPSHIVTDADGPFRRHAIGAGDTRCESGYNSPNEKMLSFARFHEGDLRRFLLEFRLVPGFPLNPPRFQLIYQWKQSGPFGNTPVLSLWVWNGGLYLRNTDYRKPPYPENWWPEKFIWQAPAPAIGVWTKFRLTVAFSYASGWARVGDGPRIKDLSTLHPDTTSHLRRGIYHDPSVGPAAVDHRLARVLG